MWFGKPRCGLTMKVNKFKLGESSGGSTMTSLHQFLSWLRERSKKAKMRQTPPQHPASSADDGFPYGFSTHAPISAAEITHLHGPPPPMMTFAPCGVTAPLPGGPPQRDSTARASMKLPPIPREAMRLKCAARNLHTRQMTDSPHVYEEISHLCMDPSGHRSPTPYEPMPDEVPVDFQNLDFRHAQEFGPYLVVPIKDKLCGHLVFAHTADVSRPPPDVSAQNQSTMPPSSGTVINPPPSEFNRGFFPGDTSSSDSGFQSVDGGHRRGERAHPAMYDGFSYTHIGPNDLQKLSCRVRGDVTYNVNAGGHSNQQQMPLKDLSRDSPSVSHPALHTGHTTITTTANSHHHHRHHTHQPTHERAFHTTSHTARCNTPHPGSDESRATTTHVNDTGGCVNGMLSGLEAQFNKSVTFSDDVKEYKITNSSRSSAIERELQKYKSQSFVPHGPNSPALKTKLSVQCESKESAQHSASRNCSKVSPRSISESDSGNSSVYAYSGSDKDAMSLPRSTSRQHESDSSNDTFSEYDIRSGEESSHSEHTEYEYFLGKAKYNLWLKHDVLRVIRESESSDYDSTAVDVESDNDSNSSSLTTVTSLSDASILSLDDPLSEIIKYKLHQKHLRHKRHAKSSTLPSSHKHELMQDQGRTDECNEVDISAKNECRTEKPDRHFRSVCAKCGHMHSKRDHCKPSKKRTTKSSRSTVQEYYSLPDFPSSHHSEQPGTPRTAIELTQQEAKDFDALERLSCRATDYRPVGYKLPPPTTSGAAVHAAGSEVSSVASMPATKAATLESSAKGPRRDQNRMLTDIMKMNHDRQLLFF